MNSQQELLDAINAITENKEKSFDTPATVLRVDGDTVWVHIDGGADETPVRKTINCEQGESVQVRISNGSAFLVGNASAPPTDDKTANVAHFVAKQADIKAVKAEETATEVKETVEVLEVEVDGKVDVGTSNIQHLSSTMYQNANGVNIYNDTLAVGDSYAHIDGDSFDIKEVTTAGTIDDVNDTISATFGRDGSLIQNFSETQWAKYKNYIQMTGDGIKLARSTYDSGQGIYTNDSGWEIKENQLLAFGYGNDPLTIDRSGLKIGRETYSNLGFSEIKKDLIETNIFTGRYGDMFDSYSLMRPSYIEHGKVDDSEQGEVPVEVRYLRTKIEGGDIFLDGDVYDYDTGYKKTPTVLTSTTISASTTSYTFSDASITTDSVIDIYDSIFGFSPTNMTVSSGSCTITFPAQSSSHTIKLFVY